VPEGRVGGQRLQQRQVLAQAVADADRRGRVGHSDMDVQRARGRALDEALELVDDAVVARLVDVLDVAEGPVGVDAGADGGAARGPQAGAQSAERGDALAGVARHRRGELDQGRVGVGMREALGRGVGLAHAREDVDPGVRQRARLAVDDDQLLLHPDREVRLAAEARLAERGGQARPRA
jgi:hypothetical protein